MNSEAAAHDADRELLELSQTFGSVVRRLRERLHMERYLSPKTLQVIRSLRDDDRPKLGGRRCHVSVLFSDIRGFTAMTEALDAEEVVRLVNIYLNLQAEVVYERGGVVDKFVGDEVMAIFTEEDSEYRAALAAQEIRNFARSLNEARVRAGKRRLSVGIGLNSGSVIMGNMGSERQMDYTVIGDPINTAARLCSLAAPGQVVVSGEVGRRLAGRCELRELEPARVKGKRDLVAICELLDVPGIARSHMRRRLDLSAGCLLAGLSSPCAVRIRDISQGGCSIESPVTVASGAQMELVIPLAATGREPLKAVVCHARQVEDRCLAGLRFEGMGEDARGLLTEWIHHIDVQFLAATQA